eukprot:scaffold44957_cov41-Phaeocystis_antarctica.AAC.2
MASLGLGFAKTSPNPNPNQVRRPVWTTSALRWGRRRPGGERGRAVHSLPARGARYLLITPWVGVGLFPCSSRRRRAGRGRAASRALPARGARYLVITPGVGVGLFPRSSRQRRVFPPDRHQLLYCFLLSCYLLPCYLLLTTICYLATGARAAAEPRDRAHAPLVHQGRGDGAGDRGPTLILTPAEAMVQVIAAWLGLGLGIGLGLGLGLVQVIAAQP